MKADIHPTYYENLKITCACGNIIIAGSTRKELKTELCSACHPFYTGKQKLIDTAGRVDKFLEKVKKMQSMKAKKVKTADTADTMEMENTFKEETVEFQEEKPQEAEPKVVAVAVAKKKAKKDTVKKVATKKIKEKAATKQKKVAGSPKKKAAGKKTASEKKSTKTKK